MSAPSTDLSPEVLEAFRPVEEKANVIVAEAVTLKVTTAEQAEYATQFLAEVKRVRTETETARKVAGKPFKDALDAINAHMKARLVPLDEADALVRPRVVAYQEEQQRKAREEQARLDAERRWREWVAEEQRREAAAAAAEAERVAREQEAQRQATLREAQNERAREIAAMSDDALRELLAQRLREGNPEHSVVRKEVTARVERAAAQQRADEQRRLAEEAQQAEIQAKSAPVALAPVARLASSSGAASLRRERKATIVDETRIPREYLMVDTAKINRLVKSGAVTEIPGVLIEDVSGLAVRSSR